MSIEDFINAAWAGRDPSDIIADSGRYCGEFWETLRRIKSSPEVSFRAQTPVIKVKRRKKGLVRERLEDYPLFAWAAEQERLMSDPMHSIGIDLNAPLPMESAAFLLKLVIDQSSSVSSDVAGEGADHARQFQSEGR